MKTNASFRRSNAHIRYISLASVISIFLLIVVGGIVRATNAGGACFDWPACIGVWTPPATMDATISYFHRVLSMLVGVILAIGVIIAWIRYRINQSGVLYYISFILILLEVGIGGVLSIYGSDPKWWYSSIHLGLSLILLAIMTFATVLTFTNQDSITQKIRFRLLTPFAKSSAITLVALGVLLISGVAVTSSSERTACASWPICNGTLNPISLLDWINIIHRISVLVTGLLILRLVIKAWRIHRSNPTILVTTTAAAILFFSQAILASQMVNGYPVHQLILHQSTAAAVWATMVVLVSYAGVSNDQLLHELESDKSGMPQRQITMVKDLLMLTKPIVVALLLVTTYAGMVIGAKELPPLSLTFWTLLGGFMAAGGSGAINQYIDRYDDYKMQRTHKRPIPAGRLSPAEGLAFGVAMTVGSFFVMVSFVNLPAALLTLAGIVYYVLIYSIFLKKTTVQNIVIGGGAGAIPPLVGWAAATGGLNIPSLFLFVVIFMWTPPHFWALALVRRKDYARAGIPMLPVIRGEKETRWQIFLYTIELFGLTLLLPIFGLGGSVYLIGAVILGVWLLSAAWRLWKQGGNKRAWKMYRYSSMYLAFLFVALMIDALM